MTTDPPDETGLDAGGATGLHRVDDPAVRIRLESHLPESLPPGARSTVFCFGHCFALQGKIQELRLLVDGVPHRPSATRMPRGDLGRWLAGTPEDPSGHSYRSGFWATLPLRAPGSGAVELVAEARTTDGHTHCARLGSIPIRPTEASIPQVMVEPETVLVCLATFDPDPELLEAQIRSLRAQSHAGWVCLISDGGSAPPRFARLLELTEGDPRFVLNRSERRLGPYENFERALRMVPATAELVALCDQDDRWYPEKLATLRGALGSAQLVYSDQRLIDESGRVIRASLWEGRHNDHRNLASLLVANAVPGAASLFRRSLLDVALPFPQTPGNAYHDHWLALSALALGEVRFVDRPLFDWVQHDAAASRGAPGISHRGSWRGAYFGGYISRKVQAQTLMARSDSRLTARKRRALAWFVAADRSPWAFLWLALRPLRRLIGRDETLSGEVPLAQGILWRWLVVAARRDAAFPDPPQFEQPRLRRWRTGAGPAAAPVRSRHR